GSGDLVDRLALAAACRAEWLVMNCRFAHVVGPSCVSTAAPLAAALDRTPPVIPGSYRNRPGGPSRCGGGPHTRVPGPDEPGAGCPGGRELPVSGRSASVWRLRTASSERGATSGRRQGWTTSASR